MAVWIIRLKMRFGFTDLWQWGFRLYHLYHLKELKMNEFEEKVFAAIKRTYVRPEWLAMSHVRVGTGYRKTYGGDRIIDALVVNMYPSNNYRSIAIEIKKSLGDLATDIADPLKHAAIRFYTDEFYYVFEEEFYQKHKTTIRPNVLVKAHAGIMLLRDGRIIIHHKEFHPQKKSPWSFGFVCSMLRNQALIEN